MIFEWIIRTFKNKIIILQFPSILSRGCVLVLPSKPGTVTDYYHYYYCCVILYPRRRRRGARRRWCPVARRCRFVVLVVDSAARGEERIREICTECSLAVRAREGGGGGGFGGTLSAVRVHVRPWKRIRARTIRRPATARARAGGGEEGGRTKNVNVVRRMCVCVRVGEGNPYEERVAAHTSAARLKTVREPRAPFSSQSPSRFINKQREHICVRVIVTFQYNKIRRHCFQKRCILEVVRGHTRIVCPENLGLYESKTRLFLPEFQRFSHFRSRSGDNINTPASYKEVAARSFGQLLIFFLSSSNRSPPICFLTCENRRWSPGVGSGLHGERIPKCAKFVEEFGGGDNEAGRCLQANALLWATPSAIPVYFPNYCAQ